MKMVRPKRPWAVEQLVFEMDPNSVERWLKLDHEIWTEGLALQPGFVRKEIWTSSKRPGRITATIWWESFEQWTAIDPQWLAETEAVFTAAFAPSEAKLVGELHQKDQNYMIVETVGE